MHGQKKKAAYLKDVQAHVLTARQARQRAVSLWDESRVWDPGDCASDGARAGAAHRTEQAKLLWSSCSVFGITSRSCKRVQG